MVFAAVEIRGLGLDEAALAVGGGADLVVRKNEPIFGRFVGPAFLFAELEEAGGFFHAPLLLRMAGRLEGLKGGEIALDGPVEPLPVEGETLDLHGFGLPGFGGGEGGFDLGVLVARFADVSGVTEGEEVVLDGARAVETPGIGGDTLGELEFEVAFRGEAANDAFGEFIVGGAVFGVMAETWPVRLWRQALRLDARLPSGDLGPVDFWALARLAANCFSVSVFSESMGGLSV
jgi:hypothetical protein